MIVRASGGKWVAYIDTREYRDGLGYRLMRGGWIYEREPRAHYWTTDPLVAGEWAEHADPATRQAIEEQARRLNAAIEMSRATSGHLEADLPLKLTPYPYQVAGIAACEGRRAVLLADEPGLGKTLQALAVVALRQHYPCLIVCPASMRLTWRYEILRTISGVSESDVSIVYGRSIADIAGTKYIIIGYDILPQRWQQLAALGMKAIILDESHYTKTLTSKRTMAVRDLVKAAKPSTLLLLTGTPVLNRPAELVSQLEIMGVMQQLRRKADHVLSEILRCEAQDDMGTHCARPDAAPGLGLERRKQHGRACAQAARDLHGQADQAGRPQGSASKTPSGNRAVFAGSQDAHRCRGARRPGRRVIEEEDRRAAAERLAGRGGCVGAGPGRLLR
jgi:hypothetical protein